MFTDVGNVLKLEVEESSEATLSFAGGQQVGSAATLNLLPTYDIP
jgi:hypothetical protein